MPKQWSTIWSSREPCRGVYDKMDPREIPPQYLAVGKNLYFDSGKPRRRKGYEKCHRTSMLHGCYGLDGKTHNIVTPYATDLDLGTDWTVEIVTESPLPTARPVQETLLSLFNTSNRAFHLYKDASNVIQFRADTATETFSFSGGAYLGKTKQTWSVRRVGLDVFLYLNGVQVGTDAITINVANKVAASPLIWGALANSAAGNIATGEYANLKIAEVRYWSVARSVADILANHAKELATSDNTGLVHYWRTKPEGNKLIIKDSRDHITLANRRNSYANPCRRVFVDRNYPECVAQWDSATPGIPKGRRWSRWDGIELFDKQESVPKAAEEVFNKAVDGKFQWAFEHEFLIEKLPPSGTTWTVLDWGFDATNPHLRLDVDDAGLLTLSSRWGGTTWTAVNTVAIAACQPIRVEMSRDAADLQLITDRIDTGASVDDKTNSTGDATTGQATAGRDLYIGARDGGTQIVQGAAGELVGFRERAGVRNVQGAIPSFRMKKAIMHVSSLPRGRFVEDKAAGVDMVSSCAGDDEDDDDGAGPDECIPGFVPSKRGHGVGIYDFQERAPQGSSETVKQIILDFAGALYRSPNLSGVKCVWERIYSGRTAGRTHLTSWARFENQLCIFNGIDKNVIYDGEKCYKLGIDAPATAATVVEGIGGNLLADKTYTYVVVFYDPFTGHESQPSAEFSFTNGPADSQADITALPLSTDPDRPYLQRRIYRTKNDAVAESELFYRIATIDDNTTTTYTDDTVDTLLSPSLRLERDEFGFFVNGVLPVCKFGVNFQGRLWAAGDPENPTAIYFTRVNDIQAHPASYTLNLTDYGTGDPITGIAATWDRIFAFTERSIWEITAQGSFFTLTQRPVVPNIGAAGHWGIENVDGVLYFLNPGDQRVYRYDGQGQPLDVSDPIDQTFFGMSQETMKFSSSAYMRKRDTLLFTASTGSFDDTQPDDLGYPENDVVLALNLKTKAWSPWDIDCNVLGVVEDPVVEENQVFGFDYSGFLRKYDTGENDGYDLPGTRFGTLITVTDASNFSLLDHVGGAANLDVTDDGLAGLEITIVTGGVEQKGRIVRNTATGVTIETALGTLPVAGDEWWIAGIDMDIETAALDFEYAVHLKSFYGATIHYSPQTGNAQDGKSRVHAFAYQDDTTSTRTSVPARQEKDQIVLEPNTKNPLWRFAVEEAGIFHTLRLRAKYPDEPCEIYSLTLEWKPLRITAIQT